MSAKNPFFDNSERASYELAYLLRKLPISIDPDVLLPGDDESLMVEAAAQHAYNLRETLMRGVEGIGHLLFCAGFNKTNSIDRTQYANVGMLLTEIAGQMQMTTEFGDAFGLFEARMAQKGSGE